MNFNRAGGIAVLWAGWWLAGAAWALHLAIGWTVVDWYCHNRTGISAASISWILNLVSLTAIAMAGAGIVLAWRNRRRLGQGAEGGQNPLDRSGFMARAGILISCFFLGIILMQSLPNLILGPCQ